MARSKVKLAWIANDATRRTTMRKRCKGLIKKVSEISTLCGVDATIVMYTSADGEPEVWPNMQEAKRLLSEFREFTELEQNPKIMNHETFLSQKIAKLQEQLRKEEAEVRELEIKTTIYEGLMGKNFDDLEIETAGLVASELDNKIYELTNRLAELQGMSIPSDTIQSALHFGQASNYINGYDGAMVGGMNMRNMVPQYAVGEPTTQMMMMMMMIPSSIGGPAAGEMVNVQQKGEQFQGQNWMVNTGGNDEQQFGDQVPAFWPNSYQFI